MKRPYTIADVGAPAYAGDCVVDRRDQGSKDSRPRNQGSQCYLARLAGLAEDEHDLALEAPPALGTRVERVQPLLAATAPLHAERVRVAVRVDDGLHRDPEVVAVPLIVEDEAEMGANLSRAELAQLLHAAEELDRGRLLHEAELADCRAGEVERDLFLRRCERGLPHHVARPVGDEALLRLEPPEKLIRGHAADRERPVDLEGRHDRHEAEVLPEQVAVYPLDVRIAKVREKP